MEKITCKGVIFQNDFRKVALIKEIIQRLVATLVRLKEIRKITKYGLYNIIKDLLVEIFKNIEEEKVEKGTLNDVDGYEDVGDEEVWAEENLDTEIYEEELEKYEDLWLDEEEICEQYKAKDKLSKQSQIPKEYQFIERIIFQINQKLEITIGIDLEFVNHVCAIIVDNLFKMGFLKKEKYSKYDQKENREVLAKQIHKQICEKITEQDKNLELLKQRKIELIQRNCGRELSFISCGEDSYMSRKSDKWKDMKILMENINRRCKHMENLLGKEKYVDYPVKYRKTAYIKTKVGIGKFIWKYAKQSQVEEIELLKSYESNNLFGEENVSILIEHAYLCITLLHRKKIIGFICINDYPNIKSVQSENWKEFMQKHYGISNLNEIDTRFVHLMLWKEEYRDRIVRPLMKAVFEADRAAKMVIILAPAKFEVGQQFKKHFKCASNTKVGTLNYQLSTVYATIKYNYLPFWELKVPREGIIKILDMSRLIQI